MVRKYQAKIDSEYDMPVRDGKTFIDIVKEKYEDAKNAK